MSKDREIIIATKVCKDGKVLPGNRVDEGPFRKAGHAFHVMGKKGFSSKFYGVFCGDQHIESTQATQAAG